MNLILIVQYDERKVVHLALVQYRDFGYDSFRVPDEALNNPAPCLCGKTLTRLVWDHLTSSEIDKGVRCSCCWAMLRGEAAS